MFLLLVNIALLLIGMLLEPVAALLITIPVLLPAAIEFGIDPLHFGIVMILNLVLGLLTPRLDSCFTYSVRSLEARFNP